MIRKLAVLIICLLIPRPSFALQLKWLGGGTDISFTSTSRCTLIVSVSAPDTELPRDLRVSWVARNCADVRVVAEDITDPADLETRVDEVVDRTQLESGSRFQNVRTISPGAHSTVGRFILELPDTARGNIRAQALRRDGGLEVSNTVTFNAGIIAPFAPVVFASKTVLEGNSVVVHARGIGLTSARAVRLVTADTSWSAPLDLVQRDDTSLTARDQALNSLPAAIVQVTSANGDRSAIAGSSVTSPAAPAFSGSEIITDPNPSVVLKDFALVYDVARNPATSKWEGLYHVYYIRQIAGVGRVLAHQFTADMSLGWSLPDTTEFVAGAGGGAWDAAQVWAPSLIKRGGLWYMFYTGLDASGKQNIGYATKASLRPDGTQWQRRTTATLTEDDVPYVDRTPPVQLRDPFVIEDPDLPGRLLMMYTAQNDPGQGLPIGYTIGLSRSIVDPDHWGFLGRYIDTDYSHTSDRQDESPHAFRDPNVSTHWRLMWTAAFANYDRSIDFEQNQSLAALSSTTVGSWGGLTHLYDYTDRTVGLAWAGTEFLHTGEYLQGSPGAAPYGYTDFLAGYLQSFAESGIVVTELAWGSVDTTSTAHQDFALDVSLAGVGGKRTRAPTHPSLRARATVIRAPGVCATAFLPSSEAVVVDLLDVTGRVVRELLRQRVSAGETPVFWDMRDGAGAAVHPGMFFVRLRGPSGDGVTRFVVLR